MDQHHDPDNYDRDLDRNLGRPIYQGDGLTVRELDAEELQRFLDATRASPPGGWAAAGQPWTRQGTPTGVPGPLRRPPDPRRRSRPGRSPAA